MHKRTQRCVRERERKCVYEGYKGYTGAFNDVVYAIARKTKRRTMVTVGRWQSRLGVK